MTEALIGPNAIIQVAGAIQREFGPDRLGRVMRLAQLEHYISNPPEHMVSESEVTRLHQAVVNALSAGNGCEVMWHAGQNTARYLLANRIPRSAQVILKVLPAPLAARLLLKAIERHAWTFAGSSQFRYCARHPVRISLTGSPMFASPASRQLAARYFEATFVTLFCELVSARTSVVTSSSHASAQGTDGNAAACAFELDWTS